MDVEMDVEMEVEMDVDVDADEQELKEDNRSGCPSRGRDKSRTRES